MGFKEYAQVGKGRDVGLQQTYKFEAKLAQGKSMYIYSIIYVYVTAMYTECVYVFVF